MRRPALAFRAAIVCAATLFATFAHGDPPRGLNGSEPVPLPAPTELVPQRRAAPPAIPQVIRRAAPDPRLRTDDDAPDRPPLAINRQTLKEIESANEQIAKKQFPDAMHNLQRVLDSSEDSWIQVFGPKGPFFRSAKQHAADRIGSLPLSARDAYETEFGQVARQMLEDATKRGDQGELAEIATRYFHTRAGYKAAYALANRLFDTSMPLPAADLFERLRRSPGGNDFEPMLSLKEALCWLRIGATEKCRAVLAEFKQRSSRENVMVGGRRAAVPNGDDALHWLERLVAPSAAIATSPPRDWMLAGGAPDRNSASGDALSLGRTAWTQSLIRDRDLVGKDRLSEIEATLEAYQSEMTDSERLTIPSGMPLVIGKTAVFRTFARVRAVDLRTGEPVWDLAECDRLYGVIAAAQYPAHRPNRLPISVESIPDQDEVKLFLNARTFRDMTYAGMSSDGERVFALFDLGFLGLAEGQREGQRNEQSDALGARNQNILAAIDLATGRLLWELGGTRSDRNRDLAGTFFLGCGLPTGNGLYVLGELDGEISLFKLDSATGKRIWSQRLATPLGRLPFYPLRRLAGGNPSLAGGLLICPITGGVVTAVDPASKMLAWEYRYQSTVAKEVADPRSWADEPLRTGRDAEERWLDSAPVVANGAILLTPRDSDDLHCINPADGTLRWIQPRDKRLFLAAVTDGTVYVVGRSQVEALHLADGSNAWSRPIELGLPAGRGYRTGMLYHLPLASGDLVTINLRLGRVITRTRFEKGVQPGNLVSAEGSVLMESAGSIQAFEPTADLESSVAKSLEQHADEGAALASRGELRLHRGQVDAGLADMMRSVEVRPDARAQSIAVATVLENLRSDFAASRALAERFETRIVEPRHRVEFHRLMAAGLARSGDLEGALEHDLKLLEDESLAGILVVVDDSLKMQVAQIVAPELSELLSSKDPDTRSRLTKKVDSWATHIASEGRVDQLRRTVGALRGLPLAAELRRILVAKLTSADRAELVRQLTYLRQSTDAKVAGVSTARLARLLIDHHRADEALPLLRELDAKFNSVVCADGKSGAVLSRAWSAEPAVKAAKSRLEPWPASKLTVKSRPYEPPPAEQAIPISFDQHSGSFYHQWRFESRRATERGFTLAAIDSAGNERWQLELNSKSIGAGPWGEGPMAVRAHGSLLEVVLRRRIVVLDGFDGARPPQVLWSRLLYDPLWSPSAQARSEIGLTGLMTKDCMFYQFGSALCCADLLTGQTVWERRSIALNYSLEGDDDYVIALNRTEPNDPSGSIVESRSGAVRQFQIRGPLMGEWRGRRVLTTAFTPQELTRSLYDVVSDRVNWNQNYSMPAWPVAIDDQEFAVLDADRKLHVHSVVTGAQLFEAQLDRGLSAPQVVVRRVGNRYVVLRQGGPYRISSSYADRLRTESGGIWTIDRDTGKVAWSAPLPPPQMMLDLPAQSPVLVLLRPVSRFESPRTNGLETMITILDVQTGKVLHEGREATAPDRIHVRLDFDARAVIVTTDKHRLEVTSKSPG
jgi:outer membrane protein assembly factor BamB